MSCSETVEVKTADIEARHNGHHVRLNFPKSRDVWAESVRVAEEKLNDGVASVVSYS